MTARDELEALRTQVSTLATGVRTLRRRAEQLSVLRAEASGVDVRIAALERALDFDRVASHVRAAVERAEVSSSPVPHLTIANVLPAGAYRALVDAIPAPAFFEGRVAGGQRVRVPLHVAPAQAIVAWMFLTDLVRRTLGRLLVTRLAKPLEAYARDRFPALSPIAAWGDDVTLIEGRIVRRTPGYDGGTADARPWELLTGVLDLARDGDSEEYGSGLAGVPVPYRANTARVCVGPPTRLTYVAIPPDASADVVRHAYEFGIGPTRTARTALEARMERGR